MTHYKPTYRPTTLADRLLVTGQRLRADETATATTFTLSFAAKWAQAKERR